MEKYDSQMAQRVWQRVRGEQPGAGEGVGGLLMAESQAAADYAKLQRRFPEMKPLWEDTRRHIACLLGIHYLITGSRHTGIPVKPREELLDTLLRRCCAQSLKAAADYLSRSEDPEYGCVFAQLAETKRRHCRVLLECIGNMDKKDK